MLKHLFILLYMVSFHPTPVMAQRNVDKDIQNALRSLKNSKVDTSQVETLLVLSDLYLSKLDYNIAIHDSSWVFAEKAQQASSSLRYKTGIAESYLAKLNIKIKEMELEIRKGKSSDAQLSVVKTYEDSIMITMKANGDAKKTGDMCVSIGDLFDQLDDGYPEVIRMYESALFFYKQANSMIGMAETFFKMGETQLLAANLPQAEKAFLEGIGFAHKAGKKDLQRPYSKLGNVYANLGNFPLALKYGLESEKIAVALDDRSAYMSYLYNYLATAYNYAKNPDKSLEYVRKALKVAEQYKDAQMITNYASNIVKKTIDKDLPGTAAFLEDIVKRYPLPEYNEFNILVYGCFLDIYGRLKDYKKADVYKNKLASISKTMPATSPKQVHLMKPIIIYSINSGHYAEALEYLPDYGKMVEKRGILPLIVEYNYLLYKADSGMGRHELAMKQLLRYKSLYDSAHTIQMEKEVAQIREQYETEKKDKALRSREQDITLLKKQTELQEIENIKKDQDLLLRVKDISLLTQEKALQLAEAGRKDRDLKLKDQNIQLATRDNALLKSEGLLQQASIKQADTTRNIMIAGTAMLLVLLGLVYNRYRVKQRAGEEINKKNTALQQLVQEKEWLLQEIHHRVKNNLHTITSLLESQSAYVQDDALAAIKDSQHRVHTMSLVHQKLYQSNNVASIDFTSFLNELVSYLKDCFDTGYRIQFHIEAEDVHLDVSQAAPLGLVLNEAITNAVKYAFPNNRKGTIHISIKQLPNDLLQLRVQDDGIGLPPDFDINETRSLGMKLMRGLSEDFDAGFNIESNGGTTISLSFKIDRFVKDITAADRTKQVVPI